MIAPELTQHYGAPPIRQDGDYAKHSDLVESGSGSTIWNRLDEGKAQLVRVGACPRVGKDQEFPVWAATVDVLVYYVIDSLCQFNHLFVGFVLRHQELGWITR